MAGAEFPASWALQETPDSATSFSLLLHLIVSFFFVVYSQCLSLHFSFPCGSLALARAQCWEE